MNTNSDPGEFTIREGRITRVLTVHTELPPQYNVVRGATIYLSKYMVEAIPVSAISQYVIIIVNNIEDRCMFTYRHWNRLSL